MKNLILKIPYDVLVLFAVVLAIVPINDPHLIQKLGMLFSGTLSKGLDIFDLFMHATPLILLILKLLFSITNKASDKH